MNIHRIHELGIVKELDPTNNFSQPPPRYYSDYTRCMGSWYVLPMVS